MPAAVDTWAKGSCVKVPQPHYLVRIVCTWETSSRGVTLREFHGLLNGGFDADPHPTFQHTNCYFLCAPCCGTECSKILHLQVKPSLL